MNHCMLLRIIANYCELLRIIGFHDIFCYSSPLTFPLCYVRNPGMLLFVACLWTKTSSLYNSSSRGQHNGGRGYHQYNFRLPLCHCHCRCLNFGSCLVTRHRQSLSFFFHLDTTQVQQCLLPAGRHTLHLQLFPLAGWHRQVLWMPLTSLRIHFVWAETWQKLFKLFYWICKFSALTLHICTLFQIPSSVPSKPPFSPVLQSYPAPNSVPDDLAFAVRDR